MFISEHRRLSQCPGGGVQYIPGHIEPFVDLVISRYLPGDGAVVDLAGAGLRFAVPVALSGRRVTVIDLDSSSLDVRTISRRVNEIQSGPSLDISQLQALVEVEVAEVLSYLRNTSRRFALVCAFRFAHFLDPDQFVEFLQLAYSVLVPEGILALSAMTPYNLPDTTSRNEVFLHSVPVSPGFSLHRTFRKDQESKRVREQQNLAEQIHLVHTEFMHRVSKETGFEILEDSVRSTRIVAGFVLRKRH